jgi:ligand-binding sensor domain-containing protein
MHSVEGIVYFSTDNGINWKNASSGLPQKISIGLGGVAVSETTLGIATKEYGIYFYNFKDSVWVSVPTASEVIESNIGALAIFKHTIYVGTQDKGIFCSNDHGKTWSPQNKGLDNQTIRRFVEFDNSLYVCTNYGFYSLNENLKTWQLEYGNNSLQVNGATCFRGNFFIGTNRGIYKKDNHNWVNILPNHSIHNISSDEVELYAMTYNELLLSSKDGITWNSIQDGLPEDLYTFNVLNENNTLFAGQWNGVYRKTNFSNTWISSSKGLPEKYAATNLKSIHGILVITTSERKLKTEMKPEK